MYAQVAVARPIRGALTYAIPASLIGVVQLGHVVLVPLGRRGAETGYVLSIEEETSVDPKRVKAIRRILDPVPVFDARQLTFFRWVADYYLASLGMVIQTAVPSQIRARVLTVLDPTEAGIEALTAHELEGAEAQVLREVIARPSLTRRGLARKLSGELDGDEVKRATDRLLRAKLLVLGERELKETRGRVRTAELLVDRTKLLELAPRAGRRMRAIVETLAAAGGTRDVPAITAEQGGSSSSALQRLAELGVIRLAEREVRDDLVDAPALGAVEPPKLNAAQRAAVEAIGAPDARDAFLLFGVTGSGKTEVFLGAARQVLDRGRQVLVLVPEIGLTPQLVGRFKARFGDSVAVLHSHG